MQTSWKDGRKRTDSCVKEPDYSVYVGALKETMNEEAFSQKAQLLKVNRSKMKIFPFLHRKVTSTLEQCPW